ncbi:MAG: hypothetical protein RSE44_30085, partial [Pseudomonas sp.]
MSKGLPGNAPKWHGVCDKSDRSVRLSRPENAAPTTNPSSAGGFAIQVSRRNRWMLHAGLLRKLAMTTRQPLYKSLYFQVIIAI